jgi:glycosyltransferase involved in cell wall biosynthesis
MTIPATFHLRPIGERLRQLYAESDILLCPSLQEGYHNPPREAMAAQCAVVATNVGCIPHCAIAGETALVVEPGDVDGMIENLSWLIESPERIPALAQKGYEHIKKFTWEQSTTDLLEIFEHPEI